MFQNLCNVLLILSLLKLCEADHLWHSHQSYSSHQRREEYKIENFTSVSSFQEKKNISVWKSITSQNKCFVLGVFNNGITLNTLSKNGFQQGDPTVFDVGSNVVDAVLFEYNTAKKSEVIIVVATDKSELIWFKEKNGKFSNFWSWPNDKKITHINVFQIEYDYHILIVSHYMDRTTADLYAFELKIPNFWLRQNILLPNSTKSSALSVFGSNYFLSIPVYPENLLIYKLSVNNGFESYKNITSREISQVVTFNIGPKVFLVINGFQAAIFQFTEHGLTKENIIDANLDTVQYWLPIITPKGVAFLLAQRILHHGSHESVVMLLVTHNGRKFEKHDDTNCFYFGEEMSSLRCLSEYKSGIMGGTSILVGKSLALLLPRENGSSELFEVHTALNKIPNPVEIEIKELLKTRVYLENLIQSEEMTFNKIKDKFQKAVKEEIVGAPESVKKDGSKLIHIFNQPVEDYPIENDPKELTTQKAIFLPIDFINRTKEAAWELTKFHFNLTDDSIGLFFKDLLFLSMDVSKAREKLELAKSQEDLNHYKTITFNGRVEVTEDASFEKVEVEKIRGENVNDLLFDIASLDDFNMTTKFISNLKIENIEFDSVNNIEANNLLFNVNNTVTVGGNIIFVKKLEAETVRVKKVNDLVFEDSIIHLGQVLDDRLIFENVDVFGNLSIEKLNGINIQSINLSKPHGIELNDTKLDSIYFQKNVTVKNINGQNFDEFLKKICMRNIPTHIPGTTTVTGNVIVSHEGEIPVLNDLNFPTEFAFRNSDFIEITGQKRFENVLIARNVTCLGTIDGLKPSEIITKTSNQTLTGTVTFENLEMEGGNFSVGKITGPQAGKFLSNPSLRDTKLIKSNVKFTNLEVEGDIILSGNINGENLEETLSNKIYQSEDEVKITGKKEFPEGFTVHQNLVVLSHKMNNMILNKIVTKHSEQILDFEKINGEVDFGNIHISGRYGTIDVDELNQEVARKNKEEFIFAVDFENDIDVESLSITDSLNHFSHDDILINFTEGNINLKNVVAKNVQVHGNFTGEITGLDLKEFDEKRMSFSRDQIVAAEITLKNSDVYFMEPKTLNGEGAENFSKNNIKDQIVSLIGSGKIKLKNLFVNGSLKIGEINGETVSDMNLVPKIGNKHQQLRNITFKNNVRFDNIEIQSLSGVNFRDYVNSMVFKNETNPTISGTKTFLQGFQVRKLIETEKLNSVPIENLLTKHGNQKIASPIAIIGNVTFAANVIVVENINEFAVDYLLENYKVIENGYQLKGDVLFARLANINNLQIEGNIFNKSVSDHLNAIIYRDEDFELQPEIIFKNKVYVDGNMGVDNEINDINLAAFQSQVMWKTKDSISKGDGTIVFTKPVNIRNELFVKDNIEATLINGIDLNSWEKNSIFVDKGLLHGNFTFEKMTIVSDLFTDYVNDIDMNTLIPLKNEQNISEELHFEEFTSYNNITVENTVNNLNLPNELRNTVMADLEQVISTPLRFSGKIYVEKDIQLHGLLNGINETKIVTTNTDQTLLANYKFKSKVTIEGPMSVYGFVNGMNITNYRRGLELSSNETQTVEGKWMVQDELIFESDVMGNGSINGMDFNQIQQQCDIKRRYKYEVEDFYIKNFKGMCKDLSYMYNKAMKQIYKFDYLERMYPLGFKANIQNIHHFKYINNFYLFINTENSCDSYLLALGEETFQPFHETVRTGQVAQMISVYNKESLFVVIRNLYSPFCEFQGTQIWKYVYEKFTFEHAIVMEDQDLLQESVIPGTFYGINSGTITEFKITPGIDISLRKYRKWNVNEENMAFVPRGLKTGLAIRTGTKIIRLMQDEPVIDDNLGYETESIIIGRFTTKNNTCFPGRQNSDLVVMNVGIKSTKRTLFAVASHEQTCVTKSLDFIKIYEDAIVGTLFQTISTYKPSSLISLEFDNGETLLAFLEDKSILQIYEYKGIDGFKHKTSAKLEGSKMFTMTLPIRPHRKTMKKVIGLVNGKDVHFIEARMLGNRIEENFECML